MKMEREKMKGRVKELKCCYAHKELLLIYCPRCGELMDVGVVGSTPYATCHNCGWTVPIYGNNKEAQQHFCLIATCKTTKK